MKDTEIKAKILVVDDESAVRFLLSEDLTERQYEVITAESGYKLMERIQEEAPDLIVLDIKMVDYNGLDLLQDIRNKYYDLPVILYTAYHTFKEDVKSIAADFYVIKSFDLTELTNKIAMALKDRARLEPSSPAGIRKSLIRLLNGQGEPTPIAKEVHGYSALKEELSSLGFSEEMLNNIDTIFEPMCKKFFRKSQNLKKEIYNYFHNCDIDRNGDGFYRLTQLFFQAYSDSLISYTRFERLNEMELLKLKRKISFLRQELPAVARDLSQGKLSREQVTEIITTWVHVDCQNLIKLMQEWCSKLECGDIKGLDIDNLYSAFYSVPRLRFKTLMIGDLRHDLKNLVSNFIIFLQNQETSKSLVRGCSFVLKNGRLNEIVSRLKTLVERLSIGPEDYQSFSPINVADDLTGVISELSAIYSGVQEESSSENKIEELKEHLNRMKLLLKRINDFSVFSMEVESQSFNLNNFVQSVVQELGIADDPWIRIHIDTSAKEITADPRLLGLALRNVIQNATEAVGEDGRVEIAAKVKIVEGAKQVEFRITDDGPGIPADWLEKAFEPKKSYKKLGHSGMGLSLAREAIKELGGSISLYSRLNRGTTVKILIRQEA